eukprot:GCRY01004303.1.p1 GENE.GCRY01004303.1~~GCRY01004303.1.p1  ORF type:complete len:1004 (+),score=201.35 GCRY01004303.1:318-3329(+)
MKDENAKEVTPLPRRDIAIVAVLMLLYAFSLTVLFPFIVFMVKDFNVAEDDDSVGKYCGWLGSAYVAGQFAFGYQWGRLADKFGRKPVLVFCSFCNCVSLLFFGLSFNYYFALGIRFFSGATNGISSVCKTYIADVCDSTNRDKGFSIIAGSWQVGLTFGPLIGGVFARPCLRWPSVFSGIFCEFPYLLPCLIGFSFGFVAFLLTLFLMRESHPRAYCNLKRELFEAQENPKLDQKSLSEKEDESSTLPQVLVSSEEVADKRKAKASPPHCAKDATPAGSAAKYGLRPLSVLTTTPSENHKDSPLSDEADNFSPVPNTPTSTAPGFSSLGKEGDDRSDTLSRTCSEGSGSCSDNDCCPPPLPPSLRRRSSVQNSGLEPAVQKKMAMYEVTAETLPYSSPSPNSAWATEPAAVIPSERKHLSSDEKTKLKKKEQHFRNHHKSGAILALSAAETTSGDEKSRTCSQVSLNSSIGSARDGGGLLELRETEAKTRTASNTSIAVHVNPAALYDDDEMDEMELYETKGMQLGCEEVENGDSEGGVGGHWEFVIAPSPDRSVESGALDSSPHPHASPQFLAVQQMAMGRSASAPYSQPLLPLHHASSFHQPDSQSHSSPSTPVKSRLSHGSLSQGANQSPTSFNSNSALSSPLPSCFLETTPPSSPSPSPPRASRSRSHSNSVSTCTPSSCSWVDSHPLPPSSKKQIQPESKPVLYLTTTPNAPTQVYSSTPSLLPSSTPTATQTSNKGVSSRDRSQCFVRNWAKKLNRIAPLPPSPRKGDDENVKAKHRSPANLLLRDSLCVRSLFLYGILCFSGYLFNELYPLWAATDEEDGGLGMDSSEIGVSMSAASALVFFFQVNVFPLLNKPLGPRRTEMVGALFDGLFFALFTFLKPHRGASLATSVFLLSLAILLKNCANTISFTSATILVANSVPPLFVGTINGLSLVFASVGRMIAPITGGYLYSWAAYSGNPWPFNHAFPFVLGGTVLFLSIFLTYSFPSSINRKREK